MALFADVAGSEPLASRMRPRVLAEFIGQEHIVGPGRLLRRAIEADQLSSILFYGPPGTGKTTLARVIAGTTRAHFIAINAVLGGVKDIRDAIAEAQDRAARGPQRTLLFIDEVHRFNKAQQDALLPWVENGTVVLIGATTENPYFEVNKALVSRSRIFQLRLLEPGDLRRVAAAALADPERGYGRRRVNVQEEALEHLVDVANGDARALLNALELAVDTTPPGPDGVVVVDLQVAEESIQRRAVLYDKEGDAHFDIISAFIKSVRGSDPDAALYWLAKMVHAGEDPRYILRRLVILASEDVGLADPGAVAAVMACATAYDRIGMPEGRFPLAQATLHLATAPKSNSTMAFFDALAAVEREREADVPNPLRDGNRDKEGFGHGAGYLYPHAYRDHWVAQQYLPAALQGRTFYAPSDQGHEATIAEAVARRREAQLAAMVEAGPTAVGNLTFTPRGFTSTGAGGEKAADRWLQRTLGQAGAALAAHRDAVFAAAEVLRHHVVLDVRPGTGLFTWEAVRRAPEGHVWAWAADPTEVGTLEGQAARLPELRRPRVFAGAPAALAEAAGGLRFDRVVGRAALVGREPWLGVVPLAEGGRVVLVEPLARHTPRLTALVPADSLGPLHARWAEAEEAVYTDPSDPFTAATEATVSEAFAAAGLAARVHLLPTTTELLVTGAVVDRWFAVGGRSYGDRLRGLLGGEVSRIEAAVRAALEGRSVPWRSVAVVAVGE